MTNYPSLSWLGKIGKIGRKFIVFVLFVLVFWILFGTSIGRNLIQSWLNSRATTFSTSPIIVTKLQALNRLETASQVSQQVVEASSNIKHLPEFLGKDRLLMQVQTEMIAGINMSLITEKDVEVKGKTVKVRLPAPELFTVRIDDEHTKVFSREHGWLVLTPDVNLEGQARQKVLSEARETGNSYLLPTARTNAEKNVRQLLSAIGFEIIEIKWADQLL